MNGSLCSNCAAIAQLSNPDIKSEFSLHSLKTLEKLTA